MPTRKANAKTRSQLFTVRVWSEDVGAPLAAPRDGGDVEAQQAAPCEWRGKVQCVASGETFYFRDWEAMTEFLVETLESDTGEIRK